VSVDINGDPEAAKAIAQIGFVKAALQQFINNSPVGGSAATAMAGALAALNALGKGSIKGEE
jgi:hypothetical protein